MRIVSNTSPLIFLTKISRLDFLKGHEILIPSQVFDEVKRWKGKGKDEYLVLEDWFDKNKVNVKQADALSGLPAGLGEGEKAAISLAVKEKISLILLDERKARIAARLLGLKPRGTIAVIYEQLLKKKITKNECKDLILELVKKGYRIKEELLAEFLQSLEKKE